MYKSENCYHDKKVKVCSGDWRDNGLSLHTKITLYEALVLSTVLYHLYGAETWSMSVSNTKKLKAAHHRWQKKILKISWKDMVRYTQTEKKQQK